MKKSLISASAIALALAAGSAFAADLPSRKEAPVYVPPPPPPPPPLWTGFYGGLNIGGGWTANSGGNNVNAGGVVGGGQLGFNYSLTPMFLVGVETDFQGTSIGSGGTGNTWWTGNIPAGIHISWFGTVRGRAGVTLMPTLLIYGTGGFAYAEINRNFTGGSATQTGWTAGGGVEWMFMPNWSAKAEYLYTDVSGSNTNWGWNPGIGLNNVNNHTRWNTVRAGVNYHFNFGGNAPVLAKY
jgi:outer membrane immunogenic protein